MSRKGRIRRCSSEDVPSIAELHARVFWCGDDATVGLRNYYEKVLFEHPWRNDDFPSYVFEDSGGEVRGLVAAMPRPILLRGKPSWIVAVHRTMAESGSVPFLGVRLLQTVLNGSQSFTLADWSSDAGRKAWKRAGGEVQAQISLSWHSRLRPVQYKTWQALRTSKFRPVMYGAWPFARALDLLLKRGPRKEASSDHEPLAESELGVSDLLVAFERATSAAELKPVYDLEALRWVFDFLTNHPTHGRFEARKFTDERGDLAGWCLQHCKQGVVDVLQFGAVRGDVGSILHHILEDARDRGMLAVQGRVEPRTFEALAAEKCLFTAGYAWALIHSHDPGVRDLIQDPATFLSSLEGERWLCNVDERL